MSGVLSNRVLNRTLLARQHLLRRTDADVGAMLDHLVGVQAQDVVPPFVALWSRIAGFDPHDVSDGLDDRSLARITLMRGTIHLVTAADAVRIASHIQPELEKIPFRKGFFFGATVGLDLEEVRAIGETLLDDQPTTAAELRARARERWPDRDDQAMLQALLYLLPVMQTPPRGRWKANNRPTWVRTEAWLGRPLEPTYPLADLVLRYLRAFGPATTTDIQAWSKFVGIKDVVDRLGDRVRTYSDEAGRTLYDVADGVLGDPDEPAPVRFLGWYDNALLSHRDRTRIVPENQHVVLSSLATNRAAVLVDGYVAGLYKIAVERAEATMRLALDERVPRSEYAAIEAEGLRLVRFLEPGKQARFELER